MQIRAEPLERRLREVAAGGHQVVVRAELGAERAERLPDQATEAVAAYGVPVGSWGREAEPSGAGVVHHPPDESLAAREDVAVVQHATELGLPAQAGILGVGVFRGAHGGDDRSEGPPPPQAPDPRSEFRSSRVAPVLVGPPMPNTMLPSPRPPHRRAVTRASIRRGLFALGRLALGPVFVGCLLLGCSRPLLNEGPSEALLPSAAVGPVGDGFDPDVRRLEDPDFVTRARAAERLVAAGPAALPALGRRGDQPVVLYGKMRVSTTRPVIRAILDAMPDGAVRRELASGEAVVRRAAAEALGRRGRWGSVAALIDATEDPEPTVRASSAASLRRLTNRFFGFRAEASPTLRAAATQRWRTWWTIEGRLEAPTSPDDAG